MFFADILSDYSLITIVSLTVFCLIAGFLDAVVGGGGLITVPTLLINFPNTALPTLFGTNKIAGLCGTSVAAYQYRKQKSEGFSGTCRRKQQHIFFGQNCFLSSSLHFIQRVDSEIEQYIIRMMIHFAKVAQINPKFRSFQKHHNRSGQS